MCLRLIVQDEGVLNEPVAHVAVGPLAEYSREWGQMAVTFMTGSHAEGNGICKDSGGTTFSGIGQ